MRWSTIGQFEERFEQIEFFDGIFGDFHPSISASSDGRNGNSKDVPQVMKAQMLAAGVRNVGKTLANRSGIKLGHDFLLRERDQTGEIIRVYTCPSQGQLLQFHGWESDAIALGAMTAM
jgi:hypothetical protein